MVVVCPMALSTACSSPTGSVSGTFHVFTSGVDVVWTAHTIDFTDVGPRIHIYEGSPHIPDWLVVSCVMSEYISHTHKHHYHKGTINVVLVQPIIYALSTLIIDFNYVEFVVPSNSSGGYDNSHTRNKFGNSSNFVRTDRR